MAESGTPRDFDFWIGEWDVVGPQGNQAGTNSITPLLDGGALAEHWHGTGGVEGHSINAYDTTTGRWHQTWVDSTGGFLLLEGGLVGADMVLEGTVAGTDGAAPQRQRITWTPGSDGVRQHWESSDDDGASWQTAFDGRYRPRQA
jgi:hypothetical protein